MSETRISAPPTSGFRGGTCERCGEPFVDRSPAQRKRYCSDRCRKDACEDRHIAVCSRCGEQQGRGSAWESRTKGGHCASCLSELSQERRARFVALREEGLNNTQIAEREGVSREVVSTEIYRALHWDGRDVPQSPYWSRGKAA